MPIVSIPLISLWIFAMQWYEAALDKDNVTVLPDFPLLHSRLHKIPFACTQKSSHKQINHDIQPNSAKYGTLAAWIQHISPLILHQDFPSSYCEQSCFMFCPFSFSFYIKCSSLCFCIIIWKCIIFPPQLTMPPFCSSSDTQPITLIPVILSKRCWF